MHKNRWKLPAVCALLLAGGLFTGCESSSDDSSDDDEDDSQPRLAVFNAVSDMGTISVITGDDDEEEVWSHLDFAESVSAAVNDGEIDYRFETALPSDDIDTCVGDEDEDGVKDDDECTHLEEGSVDIVDGNEYLLVLFGKYQDMEVLQYEKERHLFDTEDEDEDGDAEDEDMEAWFLHLAEDLGEVDVYLEAPGTNLSPVQARDTFSLKGSFQTMVDEGEYVLTITEKADPTAVLFTSETFKLYAQTRVGFALRDGAGDGTSSIKVTLFRDQDKTLLDRNATTELRVAHTVPDGDNIDVYAGGDFTTPYETDLPFGESSDYREIAPGDLTNLSLDATPTGDAGLYLAREELDLTQGQKASFFFIGESSDWDGLKVNDDTRRIATHAQLRLINGASSTLDYYVVDQNDNISTLSATDSLSFRGSSGWLTFDPGTYDVVVTETGTDTIVFSDTIELAEDGLYTAVSTNNTADPTAADMVYLDDFAESEE
ncbi:DUF4397 domain-containing protein [Microbulbifer litoralis]|uniref:DUF4397 domain-containing protein n=1 Tax=Microbulbifer litoralis TaxID=2933965 RepID=UPI0020286FF9|nr:DUF4397 domain-containing protein [Microbulbifer sp. GX H0434]